MVPDEWQQELYNYIVLGYEPGSFHTALFANDLISAAIKSHPQNTWEAITVTIKWLLNVAPHQCFGSYERVEYWLDLTKEERKKILEEKGLLLTEEVATWKILSQP